MLWLLCETKCENTQEESFLWEIESSFSELFIYVPYFDIFKSQTETQTNDSPVWCAALCHIFLYLSMQQYAGGDSVRNCNVIMNRLAPHCTNDGTATTYQYSF